MTNYSPYIRPYSERAQKRGRRIKVLIKKEEEESVSPIQERRRSRDRKPLKKQRQSREISSVEEPKKEVQSVHNQKIVMKQKPAKTTKNMKTMKTMMIATQNFPVVEEQLGHKGQISMEDLIKLEPTITKTKNEPVTKRGPIIRRCEPAQRLSKKSAESVQPKKSKSKIAQPKQKDQQEQKDEQEIKAAIEAKIEEYYSSQFNSDNQEADPVSIRGFWKSRYYKDIQLLFGPKRVRRILRMRDVKVIRQRGYNLLRLQHLFENKYGKRVKIDIDPKCKFYSEFNIRQHEIEKKGYVYCQVYNKQPFPQQGKHYFEVRVLRLRLKMVTAGVITSDNFGQMFSMDKANCICFNGYDNSIYVQGVKHQLNISTKVNDVLRICVEISQRSIQFIINHDKIWQGEIPPHMVKKPLYPHIQTCNKAVKIKINKFTDGMKV